MNDCKKPLCPYCSAEWSDDMVKVFDAYASAGCSSCGYGQEIIGTIDITCDKCQKLIYRKEFVGE